jgi:hypothetical protein
LIYKLIKDQYENKITGVLANLSACIPFAPDNTDYQQFKKDLADGASLKDAEGNDMTAEQITTFLETLDK